MFGALYMVVAVAVPLIAELFLVVEKSEDVQLVGRLSKVLQAGQRALAEQSHLDSFVVKLGERLQFLQREAQGQSLAAALEKVVLEDTLVQLGLSHMKLQANITAELTKELASALKHCCCTCIQIVIAETLGGGEESARFEPAASFAKSCAARLGKGGAEYSQQIEGIEIFVDAAQKSQLLDEAIVFGAIDKENTAVWEGTAQTSIQSIAGGEDKVRALHLAGKALEKATAKVEYTEEFSKAVDDLKKKISTHTKLCASTLMEECRQEAAGALAELKKVSKHRSETDEAKLWDEEFDTAKGTAYMALAGTTILATDQDQFDALLSKADAADERMSTLIATYGSQPRAGISWPAWLDDLQELRKVWATMTLLRVFVCSDRAKIYSGLAAGINTIERYKFKKADFSKLMQPRFKAAMKLQNME